MMRRSANPKSGSRAIAGAASTAQSLKAEFLSRIAKWASAVVPPLGALWGHRLAASCEKTGASIANQLQCQRCETIIVTSDELSAAKKAGFRICGYCGHHNTLKKSKPSSTVATPDQQTSTAKKRKRKNWSTLKDVAAAQGQIDKSSLRSGKVAKKKNRMSTPSAAVTPITEEDKRSNGDANLVEYRVVVSDHENGGNGGEADFKLSALRKVVQFDSTMCEAQEVTAESGPGKLLCVENVAAELGEAAIATERQEMDPDKVLGVEEKPRETTAELVEVDMVAEAELSAPMDTEAEMTASKDVNENELPPSNEEEFVVPLELEPAKEQVDMDSTTPVVLVPDQMEGSELVSKEVERPNSTDAVKDLDLNSEPGTQDELGSLASEEPASQTLASELVPEKDELPALEKIDNTSSEQQNLDVSGEEQREEERKTKLPEREEEQELDDKLELLVPEKLEENSTVEELEVEKLENTTTEELQLPAPEKLDNTTTIDGSGSEDTSMEVELATPMEQDTNIETAITVPDTAIESSHRRDPAKPKRRFVRQRDRGGALKSIVRSFSHARTVQTACHDAYLGAIKRQCKVLLARCKKQKEKAVSEKKRADELFLALKLYKSTRKLQRSHVAKLEGSLPALRTEMNKVSDEVSALSGTMTHLIAAVEDLRSKISVEKNASTLDQPVDHHQEQQNTASSDEDHLEDGVKIPENLEASHEKPGNKDDKKPGDGDKSSQSLGVSGHSRMISKKNLRTSSPSLRLKGKLVLTKIGRRWKIG